jgi:hypothetical protein
MCAMKSHRYPVGRLAFSGSSPVNRTPGVLEVLKLRNPDCAVSTEGRLKLVLTHEHTVS